MTIHYGEDPFAVPPEFREPARRFRGRLVAPVTGWTTYGEEGRPAAITVSSILVAEGEPAVVLGLLDPLSEFAAALEASTRFVVHVLAEDQRRIADQLAGRYPGPDARFENIALSDSDYGPVLDAAPTRAYCDLMSAQEVGDSLLVQGAIRQLDLPDDALAPLAYFRGHYMAVRPRETGA